MSDYKNDEYKSGEYQGSDPSQLGTAMAFLVIGASIGAAVALLLAPKTGRQMRKSLRRGYEDAVDNLGEWSGDVRDRASDLRDRASDVADEVKNRATKLADSAQDSFDGVRQVVDGVRQTVKDRVKAFHG